MSAGSYSVLRIRIKLWWTVIRLHAPDQAILKVLNQLRIALAEITRPNDFGAVDIRAVVDPFVIKLVVF